MDRVGKESKGLGVRRSHAAGPADAFLASLELKPDRLTSTGTDVAEGDRAKQPTVVATNCAEIDSHLRELLATLSRGVPIVTIAVATGFNRESVRRYLGGAKTVPARFLLALCKCRGVTLTLSSPWAEEADTGR